MIRLKLIAIFLLVCAINMHAQRPGADKETTINIPVTAFQSPETANSTFSTGCIQSDTEAEMLIAAMKVKDTEFRTWMSSENNPKENPGSAILFVHHQFKAKDLLRKDKPAKREKICSDYMLLQSDSLQLAKRIKQLRLECDGNPQADKLDYLIYLEAKLDSAIAKMEELEAGYSSVAGEFNELDPIVNYIYHFEKGSGGNMVHSDYLLGVDQIYVILIGGKTDITGSTLSAKRGESRLETDVKSVASIINDMAPITRSASNFQIETPADSSATSDSLFQGNSQVCPLELEIAEIRVTLLHINQHLIEIPGELSIKPIGKDAITLAIHARQFVGIQAGALAGKVDLRTYTFANDTLSVTVPFEKTASKILPFVFLQVYPFGRDIDRLSPLRISGWKRYDFRNRIGLYGGLKISKKPFETVCGGVSFALGPNINLMAGLWWNRTFTEVSNYYIGPLKDEERLDDFAPTHSARYFSVGISVSPSIYKDWFGGE